MDPLISTILSSLFISSIALVGAILLVKQKLLEGHLMHYFVSFAAGVMLATAFIDLLPEALADAEGMNIFLPALMGVVIFFFLERFVLWFHHHDEPHSTKPAAVLILVGDGLHNAIDGVAIAATFLTNPSLGLVTTLAIAAHEVPQELADFSVLVGSGMTKSKALLYNFISGLTALLGAVLSFFFLESIQGLLPIALSFTAGMFIYISCSDLIPEMHSHFKDQKNWAHTLPFILGIGLTWVFVKTLEG